FYLVGTNRGAFSITFKSGFRLDVEYPTRLFPTLGVWWNNRAHPDESGCRRSELAIEPIPGSDAFLSNAAAEGTALRALPNSSTAWQVVWRVESIVSSPNIVYA
ncbi:MAG: hypothetical protein KAG97_08895, partial [Victivallales bacterium]|nr:hypothetical protein [Victivallales bacterium]